MDSIRAFLWFIDFSQVLSDIKTWTSCKNQMYNSEFCSKWYDLWRTFIRTWVGFEIFYFVGVCCYNCIITLLKMFSKQWIRLNQSWFHMYENCTGTANVDKSCMQMVLTSEIKLIDTVIMIEYLGMPYWIFRYGFSSQLLFPGSTWSLSADDVRWSWNVWY